MARIGLIKFYPILNNSIKSLGSFCLDITSRFVENRTRQGKPFIVRNNFNLKLIENLRKNVIFPSVSGDKSFFNEPLLTSETRLLRSAEKFWGHKIYIWASEFCTAREFCFWTRRLNKVAKNRPDDHLDDLHFPGSHRRETPCLIGGFVFINSFFIETQWAPETRPRFST